MVVDRLGVTGLAVPQPFYDAPPAGQELLGRRGDRLEVFDPDGAQDVGQHPRGRTLEVHVVARGECLEQLVGVARVNADRFEIARDVRSGQPEFAARRGQIRCAARCQQVEADGRIVRSRRAAVIGLELQGNLADGEDLQYLSQRELSRSAHELCVL